MKYSATIFMMFLVCYLHAQHINLRKYTIEDGLVNNDILNIYQTAGDFIWLCTRGGLSRYDGSRFTNFTTDNGLTHDMINDIIEIGPREFIVAQKFGRATFIKKWTARSLIPGNKLIINRFCSLIKSVCWLLQINNELCNGKWIVQTGKTLLITKNVGEITALNDSLWLLEQAATARLMTPSLDVNGSSANSSYTITVFTDSRQRNG
jgi:hypothetical protein